MNFSDQYEIYRAHFEEFLQNMCAGMAFKPQVLTESMRYSLLCGGKRVRPVLFFSALDAFGISYRGEEMLAYCLECIHTYSLIHDDLPAMDNDDFRRGKPSNHKVFGEANAILAGDALLSYAFDGMLKEGGRDTAHLRAAQALSRAAGAEGMVAGQSLDLLCTGAGGGEDALLEIYRDKTGRLIAAPVLMAAILSGKYEQEAEKFGLTLGALFQITDDILDAIGTSDALGKTTGKDAEEDKLTAVKVYGLEGACVHADEYANMCHEILHNMTGADTKFLSAMVDYVRRRDR